jgi:hypothetical protein
VKYLHLVERKDMSENTTIRKVEIERLSVRSSKPFDAVVATLKAGVGRLDLVEFAKASKSAGNFSELEKLIGRDMGATGLMLFIELDHGAVLRKEPDSTSRRWSGL